MKLKNLTTSLGATALLLTFLLTACKNSNSGTYIIYKIEPQDAKGTTGKEYKNKEIEDVLVKRYTARKLTLDYQEKFLSVQFLNSNEQVVLAKGNSYDGTPFYSGDVLKGTAKLHYLLNQQKDKTITLEIEGQVAKDKPVIIPAQMGAVLRAADSIAPNKGKVLCYLEKVDH